MLIIDSLNKLGDAPLLPEHLQGQGVQPDQAGQGQQGFGAAAGIFVMQQVQQLGHCATLHEPLQQQYLSVQARLSIPKAMASG